MRNNYFVYVLNQTIKDGNNETVNLTLINVHAQNQKLMDQFFFGTGMAKVVECAVIMCAIFSS